MYSNDDRDPETTPSERMNLYYTFGFRKCLDAVIAQPEVAQGK